MSSLTTYFAGQGLTPPVEIYRVPQGELTWLDEARVQKDHHDGQAAPEEAKRRAQQRQAVPVPAALTAAPPFALRDRLHQDSRHHELNSLIKSPVGRLENVSGFHKSLLVISQRYTISARLEGMVRTAHKGHVYSFSNSCFCHTGFTTFADIVLVENLSFVFHSRHWRGCRFYHRLGRHSFFQQIYFTTKA